MYTHIQIIASKLMKAAINFDHTLNPSNQPVHLPEHPFGLKMPEEYFISVPGRLVCCYTNMTCFLGNVAKEVSHGWSKLLHLRVIKAKFAVEEDDRHRVYYEVVFNGRALLYDGATDCSGTGGMMNDELQGLFQILSMIYDIEVETVKVSYQDGRKAEDYIFEADRQQHLERHQV